MSDIRSKRRHIGPRFRPEFLALEGRRLMSGDVLTYHNDNSRTGQDLDEPALTSATVNSTNFGAVSKFTADGQVDAEPLYVSNVVIPGQGMRNVVYIATENDSVYAYDADNGQLLWHDGSDGVGPSMIPPGEAPVLGSDLVKFGVKTGGVGILATPVIDSTTGTMYVEVESKITNADGSIQIMQRLHALDITTGLDEMQPTIIDSSIKYPGAGPGGDGTTLSFDPNQYKERNALTLSNGTVYLSWASNYGNVPYSGWVMGFSAKDLSFQSVFNANPNGEPVTTASSSSGGSFWNSGDGFAVDAAGNLYNTSGNGPFDAAYSDYADSLVKLSTTSGLALADYFTPSNAEYLGNNDLDFGSGGVLLLPATTDDAGDTVQEIVAAGKDGTIYVANTANLGAFSATSNNVIQTLTNALGAAEASAPAYFNGQVYFGALGKPLTAYTLSSGTLSTTPSSQTTNNFYYPGVSPSISATSPTATDGIVWAVQKGGDSILYAYDADNLSDELYDSTQAANNRDDLGPDGTFITPLIADGKVFVGTPTGVTVYGILPPPVVVTPPVTTTPPVVVTPPVVTPPVDTTPVVTDPVVTPPVVPDPVVTPPVVADPVVPAPVVPDPVETAPVAPTPAPTPTAPVTIPPPSVLIAAFPSSNPVVGGTIMLGAVGADANSGESYLTYTWSEISGPAGASPVSFSGAGINAAKLVSIAVAAPGSYQFEVSIADPSGQVVTSDTTVQIGLSQPTVAIAAFTSPTPAMVGPLVEFGALGGDPVYGEGSLTYTWTVTSLPAGATPPIFGSNGTNASKLVFAGFSSAGIYHLRVTIANPVGVLTASDISVVVSPQTVVPTVTATTTTTATSVHPKSTKKK